MPNDTQQTHDSAEIHVVRAAHQLVKMGLGTKEENSNYSIRNANNPDHLAEDFKNLTRSHPDTDYPILDATSFIQGYVPHEHPVEFEVRDKDGRLKQVVRTANIRTNVGGQWQGNLMFGGLPSIFQFAAAGTAAATGGTFTASTTGTFPAVSTVTAAVTAATAPAFAADLYAGHPLIVANATNAYVGTILTHTANTTPGTTTVVYTVDRFHLYSYNSTTTPDTLTESSATAPTTGSYLILPGQTPGLYLALSSDQSSNALVGTPNLSYSGNNVTEAQWATSELTAANGLGRSLASASFTTNPTGSSATATSPSNPGQYQLVFKFTGAGSGGTVYRSGIFTAATPAQTSVAAGNILCFESILSNGAIIAASDSLSVTWTINF